MRFVFIILSLCILFVASLFIGPVHIDPSMVMDILLGAKDVDESLIYIVLGSRVPQAVTAMLGGASLAVSGLMMQTMFRNPLAGPSILGITSGASLGVALVMLFLGTTVGIGSLSFSGYSAIIIGAFVGSLVIMGILIALSAMLRNDLMLIITGVLMSYLASSAITLLNYGSSAQGIKGYVMWGMGSFNGVNTDQMPVYICLTVVGLLLAMLLVKPMNALLLGDRYAMNLGVSVKKSRNLLLLSTGLLTAVTTAFCGPISFVGLAVPHIARLIWRTDNQRVLMPASALTGATVALLCCLVSVLPESGVIPINAVTPMVGVPVILYVILRNR